MTTIPTQVDADASGWRFAQCFGDKGEVEDITEADIIVRSHLQFGLLST